MNTIRLTKIEMTALLAKVKGISMLKAAEIMDKCDAVIIDMPEGYMTPPPNDADQTTVTE